MQADALEWATVLIPGDQGAHEGKASSHLVRTYLFKWGGDESCLVKIFNFFFLPCLTNSEVMIVDYCKSRSSAFSRSPLTFFLWGMDRPVAGFWDIWSGLRLIATIASKLEAACVLNDGNICHVHWDMSWFSKRHSKAHVKCERSFRIAWCWL